MTTDLLGITCPFCGSPDYLCTDSRPSVQSQRRRRHKCQGCKKAFTTLERVAGDEGNAPLRSAFSVGDRVHTRGLHSFYFEGTVIAVYQKLQGKSHRYIVENADGQDLPFFTHSLEVVK